MKLRFAFVIATFAAPALGQELTELPADAALPPSIQAVLTASLTEGETIDLVRRWQGDLVGDATPDQVVQAAVAVGDGNAAFLRHWIFEAQGDGFVILKQLALANGIKAARRKGQDLMLTLFKAEPDDPLCCPSGEQMLKVPLH